jgi:predicted GNAT family acetyltransferase
VVEEAQVIFKAEIGVVADGVAQIQGVWVDPSHRGQHLSEPAMAAVVTYSQKHFAPLVSLYVNDFNHAALASYRRVGFEQVGEFATVLF